MGFFTDTSVCIGCKACEVACKEWNEVPEDGLELTGMSYDNSVRLGASTWRHVAFIEQIGRPGDERPPLLGAGAQQLGEQPGSRELAAAGSEPGGGPGPGPGGLPASSGPGSVGLPTAGLKPGALPAAGGARWLMSSDVCKHCTEAACLDVCPTGALMRTEFGTVVVQDDVCNGCGYCVPACPFGVIERRESDGGAHKCTLCYDRIGDGLMPACAKACPTESIQFGPLDELRERAAQRVSALHDAGVAEARLYLEDPSDGIGGGGAFFLLLDEPEVYGLPPDPIVTTRDLPRMWRHVATAAAGLAAAGLASWLSGSPGDHRLGGLGARRSRS
jgi:formate dehydrogenase iron-sulfur subunit